jgi:hypothetical protein
LRAAREMQRESRMWNDDDDLTPLGFAYRDCQHAIEELQRRWNHERPRVELDRRAREAWDWMELALGPLDDLYGGDEAMLVAFAGFERATDEQRTLAQDAFKKVLVLLQYVVFDCPDTRERELASMLTEILLDALTPFVSRVDDALRRIALGDETLDESLARLNPALHSRYRSA